MSKLAIKVDKLHKSYTLGTRHLHVLRNVSMEVRKGEFVAIVGASGSGKSTLLHIIGLLDSADSGSVLLNGLAPAKLSRKKRNAIRCLDVGFVFQFYHLMPELNIIENVLLPAKVDSSIISWVGKRRSARRQAIEMLDMLGLGDRIKHRPRQLSGGERQRVAIARAMVNKPGILLADEPTGNLDSKAGAEIIDILCDYNKRAGQTLVMVTHDQKLASRADRILHLTDGKIDKKS